MGDCHPQSYDHFRCWESVKSYTNTSRHIGVMSLLLCTDNAVIPLRLLGFCKMSPHINLSKTCVQTGKHP